MSKTSNKSSIKVSIPEEIKNDQILVDNIVEENIEVNSVKIEDEVQEISKSVEIKPAEKKQNSEKVEIIAEEITIVSSLYLNFAPNNFKLEKDVEINISSKAFDALCEEISNLKVFLERGVIKIV